jgi:hypothetical protein
MNIKYFCLVISFVFFFSACSPLKQADRKASKNEIQYIYPKSSFDTLAAKTALAFGNTTIEGVAFTKVRNNFGGKAALGKRIFASNTQIYLIPASEYIEEWYKLRKKKEWEKLKVLLHQEAQKYVLSATTDDYGRFTFERMKPGKYYLEAILNTQKTVTKQVYQGSAYSGYGTRFDYYSGQNFNINYSDRLSTFVTVSENKSKVTVKLK